MKLRVMTYNIRHGLGNDLEDPKIFGDYDLERIGEVIRRADPHIVALQEVDRLQERSLGVDQPAVLSELLQLEHCFATNVLFKPDEYGVATLSTYPITSCENIPLPTGEGRENRGVLKASIHVPGHGSITVLNTHLQVDQPGSEGAPLAFQSDAWRVAGEDGGGCTIPSHPELRPSSRIDAIYVSDGLRVISSRAVLDHPARFASDHMPVLANLEIPGWKD